MRILITGAGGYIGRHVTAAALAAGHEVRATFRDPKRLADLQAELGPSADALSAVGLDLLSDKGWADAMHGIHGVLHTASPVPTTAPVSDAAVIDPAVEGTRRVVEMAAAAGVARVVITSSIAAVLGAPGKGPGDLYDPTNWTDTTKPNVRAYARAKTLAEQTAREIAGKTDRMSLTTINPGYVFGAPLGGPVTSSLTLIDMLLKGRIPALPRLAFPSVSVSDVAQAHVLALDALDGARILASGETLWLPEIADIVRSAVPEARVPRIVAPNWAVRMAAKVSPSLRMIASDVGEAKYTDPQSCEILLGRPLTDPRDAIAETARSLFRR